MSAVDGWVTIARLDELPLDRPMGAVVEGCELVVVRREASLHVLSGRCPHRAARLAEHASIVGDCLLCGRHGWDFRLDTGRPAQGLGDGLTTFEAHVDAAEGTVCVEREAVRAYLRTHPAVFHDDEDVD